MYSITIHCKLCLNHVADTKSILKVTYPVFLYSMNSGNSFLLHTGASPGQQWGDTHTAKKGQLKVKSRKILNSD